MLVLVAKHHDGFSMWPTRYTAHSSAHSTASSPWRGGRATWCARSRTPRARPASNSPSTSRRLTSTSSRPIPQEPDALLRQQRRQAPHHHPTDPAHFSTDPSAAAPQGFGSYRYGVDDYNRYFLNQLYELLTEYGPIAGSGSTAPTPTPASSRPTTTPPGTT